MRFSGATLLLSCSVLCGCDHIAAYRSSPATQDAAPTDAPIDDSIRVDTASAHDVGLGTDAAFHDTGSGDSFPPQDAWVDLDSSWQPDSITPDGGTDHVRCSDEANLLRSRLVDMGGAQKFRAALCEWTVPLSSCSTNNTCLSQCEAKSVLCAAGWELCSASVQRKIAMDCPSCAQNSGHAWIAGCVRDGGALLSAVADGECRCSSQTAQPPIDVAWSCNQPPAVKASSDKLHLGVVTWHECLGLGAGKTDHGFWLATEAVNKSSINRAVCCLRLPPASPVDP